MKATRDSFGEEIVKWGDQNPDVVVLDADLSKSTKSIRFAQKYPERFFQMGIAESNMISTAAGLALSGKIPFACSFGAFLTGRYDQIRMSVSYNRANVKLVGTHAGVAIGEDGHSQMGLEDVAVLRSLPNMTIYQPADDEETVQIVRSMVENPGPAYIRLTRQKLPKVYDTSYRFVPGKWALQTKGTRVALIGTGHLFHSCMEANDAMGGKFSVVNAASLKPVDADLILSLASSHELLVTAEDHYVTGGLGSAVAEVLAEAGRKTRLRRIGMRTFGESGSPEDVLKHFQLDGPGVVNQLEKFLAEKAN